MSWHKLLVYPARVSFQLSAVAIHPAYTWHYASLNISNVQPMSFSSSIRRTTMINNRFSKWFVVDERFVMHRYISTRWAVLVGLVLMTVWVNYEFIVNDTLRIDLLVIMLAMLVTKVAVMIYYRLTH
jgi:hypothetical protein